MESDLQQKLSSWRDTAGLPKRPSLPVSANERLRTRQQRVGTMCVTSVCGHHAFYEELQAFVFQPGRSPQHQSRVEDWAAFALGVFEQESARILEQAMQQELENKPREVIREVIKTVPVPAPPPPKSFFERLVFGE